MFPINKDFLKMVWNKLFGKRTNNFLVLLLVRGNDCYEIVKDSTHFSEETALKRIEDITDEHGGHFEWHSEFGYETLWKYDRTIGIQLYYEEYDEQQES